jgi:hypothetical protein
MKPIHVRLAIAAFWGAALLAQQRTPGRVAGSINNPQANRPSGAPKARQARAFAPLTADEVSQFQQAKAAMPELTESDFRDLLQFSQELHGLGKSASAVELAATLHQRGGDLVRTLKDYGLSGKQAKRLAAGQPVK